MALAPLTPERIAANLALRAYTTATFEAARVLGCSPYDTRLVDPTTDAGWDAVMAEQAAREAWQAAEVAARGR